MSPKTGARNHINAAATVARVNFIFVATHLWMMHDHPTLASNSDHFRHAYSSFRWRERCATVTSHSFPKRFSEDRRYLFAFKYEMRLLATYASSVSGFEAGALGVKRTRAMEARRSCARLISR